jgi:hypothetical protein
MKNNGSSCRANLETAISPVGQIRSMLLVFQILPKPEIALSIRTRAVETFVFL